MTPYRREYQRKVVSFYLDDATNAIIAAECKRTGENRSECLRRIIREWQAFGLDEQMQQVATNIGKWWGIDVKTAHHRMLVEWNSARIMRRLGTSEDVAGQISDIQWEDYQLQQTQENTNDLNSSTGAH